MLPMARVGHIGLYRNPDTLEPVNYYCKLPFDVAERILWYWIHACNGGSASAAISYLKEKGVAHIKLMCLIASKDG